MSGVSVWDRREGYGTLTFGAELNDDAHANDFERAGQDHRDAAEVRPADDGASAAETMTPALTRWLGAE
jgi:hypothetical protein